MINVVLKNYAAAVLVAILIFSLVIVLNFSYLARIRTVQNNYPLTTTIIIEISN